MKKSVQSLLPRRRSPVVPAIFGVLIVLVIAFALFMLWIFFTSGPGVALFATATPTATDTPTVTPTASATSTAPATDTPAPTEGPSPTPTQITYTVAEGDNLYNISLQFGIPIASIQAANNLTTEVLSVGTILIIPADAEFPTPTPSPLPTGLTRGTRIQHRVLLGESIESIALQYATTVDAILTERSNRDDLSSQTLQAGETITVPVGLATLTPTPAPATGTALADASATAAAVLTSGPGTNTPPAGATATATP